MRKGLYSCFASILLCLAMISTAAADLKEDAELIIDKARIVVEEMATSRDKSMPEDLLRDCAGIAIIPGMFKGGFIVGGSYGKGVVMAHQDGRWSRPAFTSLGAGSVGLQIGVESIDLILVVMGQKTMDSFLRTSFKLGGDIAIAAGPVGAQATAAADIMMKGGIFSYSRAKGLFAGISLEGAGMSDQWDLNEALYGTGNVKSVLYGEGQATPAAKKLINSIGKLKK